MIFALFGFQNPGERKTNTVNISSLPTIMNNEINSFMPGENTSKLLVAPILPNAMPVVDISDAVVLMVVSRSSPCMDKMAEPIRNVAKYRTMKLVTDDTMADERGCPPIFTVLTERGCSLRKKLRLISLNITMTLVILMPPDVEATHPPMNRIVKRIICEKAGHCI